MIHWQFIALIGFAISTIIVLATFLLYSNLRVLTNITQRVFRPRSYHARVKSATDVDCRG
jgi:hypothetical protein